MKNIMKLNPAALFTKSSYDREFYLQGIYKSRKDAERCGNDVWKPKGYEFKVDGGFTIYFDETDLIEI